ncbi:hypothetical protein MNBD_NITROSPIRAE01-1056 [hydrothermal vent metagenome]|uniref:VanZ-like domain-containing protein n=1 Tax=hydrothermal vent metagenome TaxID=652676 RepID=A0A3B1DR23_9ZZZZ
MTPWGSVLIYTGLIYAALPFGRGWQQFLRKQLGSDFGLSINLLLFFAALFTVFWIIKKTTKIYLLLSIIVLGALLFFVAQMNLPAERIHFLQYGILGYLIARAVKPRFLGISGFIFVLVLGSAIGLGDELIQWVLPSRVFDWWDVSYNMIGTAIGATLFQFLK